MEYAPEIKRESEQERISSSFDIIQGDIAYKLKINTKNEYLSLRVSEENNFNEDYVNKLTISDINNEHKIFEDFQFFNQFFDYVKDQIDNKYIEINKKAETKISIKLKKENIEFTLNKQELDTGSIIRNISEEIVISKKNLKDIKSKYITLINDNQKLNKEVKRLETINNNLLNENQDIKQSIIKLKEENDNLKEERKKTKKENKNLDLNMKKYIDNMFKQENKKVYQEIKKILEENKELKQENKSIKNKIEQLEEVINSFQNEKIKKKDSERNLKKIETENNVGRSNTPKNFKYQQYYGNMDYLLTEPNKKITNKKFQEDKDNYIEEENTYRKETQKNKRFEREIKSLNRNFDKIPKLNNKELKNNSSFNDIFQQKMELNNNNFKLSGYNKHHLNNNTFGNFKNININDNNNYIHKNKLDNRYVNNNKDKNRNYSYNSSRNKEEDKFSKEHSFNKNKRQNNYNKISSKSDNKTSNNDICININRPPKIGLNKSNQKIKNLEKIYSFSFDDKKRRNEIVNDKINNNQFQVIKPNKILKNEPKLKLNRHSKDFYWYSSIMNSTLQCLINIKQFTHYFLTEKEYIKNKYYKNALAYTFLEIIENLWENKPFSADFFLKKNNSLIKNKNVNGKDLIMILFNKLHKELNKDKNSISDYTNFSDTNLDKCFKKFEDNFQSNFQSIISELFSIKYDSQINCLNCKKISHNIKLSTLLIFPLEEVIKFNNQNDTITIYDCFKFYQNNNYKINTCVECKLEDYMDYKNILIAGPKILIIYFDKKYGSKCHFKLYQNINLKNFFYCKKNKYVYEIISIIFNLGDEQFIAFCKSFVSNLWYKYDNSKVTKISLNEIKSIKKTPYLLFYSLIEQ